MYYMDKGENNGKLLDMRMEASILIIEIFS